VREIVVRLGQTKLQRERVTDAHTVFTVQHERDRARDIRIEHQRDQVEHVAVVFGRIPFVRRIKVQVRVILLLQRNVDPPLGSDQPGFHLVERSQILIHTLAIRFAQLRLKGARAVGHRIHQLDSPLQGITLGGLRGVVAPEKPVENAPRIVFRRDRLAIQVIGDGASARQEARTGIDGQHQRGLAAELLRMLRDNLIQTDRVKRARLGIVQRGARKPHV
jgi:hypothetical protein